MARFVLWFLLTPKVTTRDAVSINRIRTSAAVVMGLYALIGVANAAPIVIWDQSPGALGGQQTGLYSNSASSQNFADEVFFDSDTILSAMDIYTGDVTIRGVDYMYGAVGTPIVIRIRTGSNTGPMQELTGVVSLRDLDGAASGPIPNALPSDPSFFVRARVDLATPFMFSRGVNYWIGMSGTGNSGNPTDDLGQAFMIGGLNPLSGQSASKYSGTNFSILENALGSTEFRLWGNKVCVERGKRKSRDDDSDECDARSVPEPSVLSLLGLGLLGVGFIVRPRRSDRLANLSLNV